MCGVSPEAIIVIGVEVSSDTVAAANHDVLALTAAVLEV